VSNLANRMTVSRFTIWMPIFVISSLLAMGLQIKWLWVVSIISFSVAAILDFLDGRVARSSNGRITVFGQQMDPVADKIVITMGLLVANMAGVLPFWITMISVYRDHVMNGIRAVVLSQKGEVISASRWGKYKTFLQFVGLIILFVVAAKTNFLPNYILWLIGQGIMYITVGLTIWSLKNYYKNNKETITDSFEGKPVSKKLD